MHEDPIVHELAAAAAISPRSSLTSSIRLALSNDAYQGLAGSFALGLEPHTEASPQTMLAQFLVAAGCAFGRGPYIQLGVEKHHTNLFTLIIGRTGQGKGTSWSNVREVFNRASVDLNESSGLSSGEGLVHAFQSDNDQPVRRLVHEPEFATVMNVAKREGNTVTGIMRQLWDGDRAQVMARKDPLKIEGAHLCIDAHVTPADLEELWRAGDSRNGYGNRFLMVESLRTRVMSMPTQPPGHLLNPIVRSLSTAVQDVSDYGSVQLTLSAAAARLWDLSYQGLANLSEGEDDCSALCGRARPMALRLAMIYALLDRHTTIEAAHLKAAIALVYYSAATTAKYFGKALSKDEERLRAALTKCNSPASLTEITRALGNNHKAHNIRNTILSLSRKRIVDVDEVDGRRRGVTLIP